MLITKFTIVISAAHLSRRPFFIFVIPVTIVIPAKAGTHIPYTFKPVKNRPLDQFKNCWYRGSSTCKSSMPCSTLQLLKSCKVRFFTPARKGEVEEIDHLDLAFHIRFLASFVQFLKEIFVVGRQLFDKIIKA